VSNGIDALLHDTAGRPTMMPAGDPSVERRNDSVISLFVVQSLVYVGHFLFRHVGCQGTMD
jgi:hypothetical protein